MQRYSLGQIQPVWKGPVPRRPVLVRSSDGDGFGVMDESGHVWVYGATPHGAHETYQVDVPERSPYALARAGTLLVAVIGGDLAQFLDGIEERRTHLPTDAPVESIRLSCSARTLWCAVATSKGPVIHAWDNPSGIYLGNVAAKGEADASLALVEHPTQELVGLDAAAGQEGSSFTFVAREGDSLVVLAGSFNGDDGVCLIGMQGDVAVMVSRERAFGVSIRQRTRAWGSAASAQSGSREDYIFTYHGAALAGHWALSLSVERDGDAAQYVGPDEPEGRLRVYDELSRPVLEMPSTDDRYETPWALVGLEGKKLVVCQVDALMLYDLARYL